MLGGLVGIAVSWPLSRLISDLVGLPFTFDAPSALRAFAVAAMLNFWFSLLPLHKAASVSLMEALRYE